MSNEIVGHKTFYENGKFRHEPLTKGEADAILERVELERLERERTMPDERSAIGSLFDSWLRLKDFGWQEAIYCPKDGTHFLVIEAGSTGIHECYYQGEWPNGYWWIVTKDDLYPSHPVMFKPKDSTPDEKARKA